MNWKKFFISLFVVFAILEISGYLIHMIFLKNEYLTETFKAVFRPHDQLAANMWMLWITDLIWSFFFVLIYLKGFRTKGLIDAVKYGFYIGIFCGFVNAYKTYALCPFPYLIIFYWFILAMFQSLILGIVLWWLYRKEPVKSK